MTEILVMLLLLFLVTFIAPTASFILPVRPTWLLFILPVQVSWPIVALVGIIGSTLGALPLYFVSKRVTDIGRVNKWLEKKWVKWFLDKFKKRPFALVLFLVLTPAPDQLLGILGGLEKYNLKKFLLANFVGRIIFYLPIVFIGYLLKGQVSHLIQWLVRLFGI